MLGRLKAALEATGLLFAAFGWSKAPSGDYGVFAPDGANDLYAEDLHAETALEGTVDYFTRDASDAPVAAIEAALESVETLAWYLNSVQYESDSGYIHYEWVFQDAGVDPEPTPEPEPEPEPTPDPEPEPTPDPEGG